jgi:hypothetical protein
MRSVFEAELVKEAAEEGGHELIKCLSAQLVWIGNAENSLLIWQAKSDDFDLMCGLDVQFLCGVGVEVTKDHLRGTDSEEEWGRSDAWCNLGWSDCLWWDPRQG